MYKKIVIILLTFILFGCGTDYYYSSFYISNDLQWLTPLDEQNNINSRIEVSQNSRFNEYTSPSIIATPDNYILAIYEYRKNNGNNQDVIGVNGSRVVDVYASISLNAERFAITDKPIGSEGAIGAPESHGSPISFVDKNGNIVVLAVGGIGFGNGDPKELSKISMTISSDNGTSWSKWEDLPDETFSELSNKNFNRYYTNPGNGTVLVNGTLVCMIDYKRDTDTTAQGAAILYSTDNGKNWKLGSTLDYNNGTHRFAKIIAERKDGKLLIAAVPNVNNDYNAKGTLSWYIADSINGTISQLTVNGLPENSGGVIAGGRIKFVNENLSKNGIILVHSYPTRNYTNTDGDVIPINNTTSISISEDEGVNWKLINNMVGVSPLDRASFRHSLTVFKDGTIGIILEESLGATIGTYRFIIAFRRFGLSAISDGEYRYEGF